MMTRRSMILTVALALLFTLSSGHAQEKPTRRILAIGGGTYTGAERPLPKYMLTLTGKKDPVVYYLPTAGGDAPPGIVRWYEVMNEFECRPRHLKLFSDSKTLA